MILFSSEIVDCLHPPEIANGTLEYRETYYTASARYSCEPLYLLMGPEEITCLSSSQWEKPPSCSKHYYLIKVMYTRNTY